MVNRTDYEANPLDQERSEFLGYNLDAIDQLASFAELSEGFNLIVAEVNFGRDADWVMAALERHRLCASVQFAIMEVVADTDSLLALLKPWVESLVVPPDRKLVVVVTGLDRAIGITGRDAAQILRDLNYTRDAFTTQMPHPVILVLPSFAVEKLGKGSRDFWAWVTQVVTLRSGAQSIAAARTDALEPQRMFSNDLVADKQARIDLLERLLTEYTPLPMQDSQLYRDERLNVLEELADAYRSTANLAIAQGYYQRLLKLANQVGNRNVEAYGNLKVGEMLYLLDNKMEKALEHYETAKIIYSEINNKSGEANTLQAIGDVLKFLKQSQDALQRYETAITIYRAVGDRLGEANTLKAIGDVQTDYQLAMREYFQPALNLYSDIGSTYNEARIITTSIAPTYLKQGNAYQAKLSYEQALHLWEGIPFEPGIQECKNRLANLHTNPIAAAGPVAPSIGNDSSITSSRPRRKSSLPIWAWICIGFIAVIAIGWLTSR
jgi:tetratricopeptide (TPR) repeat protein